MVRPENPLPSLTSSDGEGAPGGRAQRRWSRFLPLSALALAGLLYSFVVTHRWEGRRFGGVPHLSARLLPFGGEGKLLSAGSRVSPGSRLELGVDSVEEAFVVVLGLRADRQVAVYSPQAGPPQKVAAGQTLTLGSVGLGKSAGQERLLGVFCHSVLPPVTVQKAAERALMAAGSPEAVRTLDLGCQEASVLLFKP